MSMSQSKKSLKKANTHDTERNLNRLLKYIAGGEPTTVYGASKGLGEPISSLQRRFRILQDQDIISIYKKEKVWGRKHVYYGLTHKGFLAALVWFPQFQRNFKDFTTRWFGNEFLKKSLSWDIAAYLENSEVMNALRDLFVLVGQRILSIDYLLTGNYVLDKQTEQLVLMGMESHILSYLNRLPQEEFEVLYLNIPWMQENYNQSFDQREREYNELKNWFTELRRRAQELQKRH